PPPPAASAHDDDPGALPRRLRAAARWLRRRLGQSTIGALLVDAAQAWWRDHPWRDIGMLVAGELHANLTPVIRRHPRRALALAAGAGFVIAWWRPWRSPLVRRQLRPLPRYAGRWLLAQLRHPAVQAALAGMLLSLGAALRERSAAPPHDPAG